MVIITIVIISRLLTT